MSLVSIQGPDWDEMCAKLMALKAELWCGCLVNWQSASFAVYTQTVKGHGDVQICSVCGATWDRDDERAASLMAQVEVLDSDFRYGGIK